MNYTNIVNIFPFQKRFARNQDAAFLLGQAARPQAARDLRGKEKRENTQFARSSQVDFNSTLPILGNDSHSREVGVKEVVEGVVREAASRVVAASINKKCLSVIWQGQWGHFLMYAGHLLSHKPQNSSFG